MEIVRPIEGEILDIELEESLLKKNRELAKENRAILDKNNVLCINVMGSIGSGKTSLIKNLARCLGQKYKVGVIAGDLTTEIDATRIAEEGAEVIQINTGKECHLDANLIKKSLDKLSLQKTDILFIENVGNLICPAEFPLGAHKKIVVISVTEGPYMVIKHPFIFREADIVAINKIDLSEKMNVYPDKLRADIARLNKKTNTIETNCISGEGIGEVIQYLKVDSR